MVRESICKIIYDKGLLLDSEYFFERDVVAKRFFTKRVMVGYFVLFDPLIKFIKKHTIIDKMLAYIVRKWIKHCMWVIEGRGKPTLIGKFGINKLLPFLKWLGEKKRKWMH